MAGPKVTCSRAGRFDSPSKLLPEYRHMVLAGIPPQAPHRRLPPSAGDPARRFCSDPTPPPATAPTAVDSTTPPSHTASPSSLVVRSPRRIPQALPWDILGGPGEPRAVFGVWGLRPSAARIFPASQPFPAGPATGC